MKIINIKKQYCTNQIAIGLTNTTSNPDFWNILEECNKREITPNFTTHGLDITPEIAKKVFKLCGAVAVSIVDKEKSYDTVKMFINTGMKQVNIHCMLSKERLEFAKQLIEDIAGKDSRLDRLNAVVFLQYKNKNGKGGHTQPTKEEFKELIDFCDNKGINYGFDSCSASLYESVANKKFHIFSERCESGLMSAYISVDGRFYACSFAEEIGIWKDGIDVVGCIHFSDIWNSDKLNKWRNILLKNNRKCPLYNLN